MRRWTRQVHIVSQDRKVTLSTDSSQTGTAGAGVDQQYPELPMPKDSHLLPPQSRALLRAARAGYIYLRPAKHQDVEEEEKDLADVDESAAPVATKVERSFKERRWTQIPRHVEPPEIEYLAPRRPGLPSLYGAAGTASAVTSGNQPMRKTKVQKVDPATGNIAIYDVWVPEGQTVEGEIKDESEAKPAHENATVTKMTPAPGTVVDGVGVANAEGVIVASAEATTPAAPKRRGPPPPKRRGKGFGGRGRKRVMFSREESIVSHGPDGADDGRPEEEDEEQEEEGEGARTEDETSVSKGQEEATPTPSVKTETEAPSADKEAAPTETMPSTPAASAPPEQSNGVKQEETPSADQQPSAAPPEAAPAPVADVAAGAMEGVEQTTTITPASAPAPAPESSQALEAPSTAEQPAKAEPLSAVQQPEPQPSISQPLPQPEPEPQPPEISAPPPAAQIPPPEASISEPPAPAAPTPAAPVVPTPQQAEQTEESQQPQKQEQQEQQQEQSVQESGNAAVDQPNTNTNNNTEQSASSS